MIILALFQTRYGDITEIKGQISLLTSLAGSTLCSEALLGGGPGLIGTAGDEGVWACCKS